MRSSEDDRPKPPHRRTRLGPKLVVSFVLLVMGVVGTSGLVLYELTQHSLEAQMRTHLVAVARLLSTSLYGDVLRRLRPGDESFSLHQRLTEKLRHAREVTGASRIYAFDTLGRSLLDTKLDTPAGWPIGREIPHLKIRDRLEVERVLRGLPTHSVLFYKDDVPYMTGYAPIYAGEEIIGAVGVDIGAGFMDTMRVFERSVLVFAGLGALVTVIVALTLARSITQPVQKLVRAAREIGSGHLEHEVDTSGRDELGYLADTMEDMRRKLVARDAQLRQMLGGVAHEIRNPLGGIEIYAGLIAADLPDSDPRKQHIQKVIQEVRNLNRVISEFLQFARPGEPAPETTTVEQLVDEAFFLLAPELDQANVEFVRELADGLQVCVDAEQIKRALFNLMKNGVQAMRQGGTLTVRSRRAGREAEVQIVDTGIGMTQEVQERLFEPFFTTRERGTGLGLAVVMRALEQNGGSIQVDSVQGRGTTCRVRLPLVQAAATSGERS